MFNIDIWVADHTGGSKFYQVIRFNDGKSSFAIHHYGAMGTFTGAGKISAGQAEAGEILGASQSAGSTKIAGKTKDGYSKNVRKSKVPLGTMDELRRWVSDNLNPKAKAFFNTGVKNLSWTDAPVGASPVSTPVRPPQNKGFDAATKAHAEWGSW